ncbi:putative Golgi to plasma membrane transport vesicle coat protein [Rosellinia necatrix]|uniref:Putative Golgi to plasma membrane transport vesicle coat protein n=1 Tax=Rosellinia necatrix TaxID=77044 RepID=A0A1S7UNU6_ROSNE|nr:putative Golgi to plasma membrane transport vesicle coat protein [Rosellinia necatrix]
MTSILCLAHYCDLHGPTPLMVTEGLPVPCGRCYDDNLADIGPARSSAASTTSATSPSPPTAVTDALRKMDLSTARSSSATVPEQDAQTHRAALLRASKLATSSTQTTAPNASAVQTPPQSPRKIVDGFADSKLNANGSRRDSSFLRTYDEYVTKRANPCANCSLTLPKRQDVEKPASTRSDSKLEVQGPTMRTRAPYARVYGSPADTSPPRSNPQSSYPSDAEEENSPPNSASRASSRRRPTTSTSQSSAISKGGMPHHTHYLDYTSTHEPTVPTTYTIVRASCLRTLSFETLPRRPEATQSTPSLLGSAPCIPPSFPMNVGPGYITAPPTPQSAASGGPIFFGDPSAGYTTAYIFRIPDMHARGRKRVYAFLALSTHRERLAMKAFSFISAAFRDLAAWIQELVDAEAERAREREEEGSAVAALNAAYGNGGFGGRGPHDSGIGLGGGLGGKGIEKPKDRDRDTSSFLTGGGRGAYMQRMGGSMGPSGFTPKARGLAELVGLPDFFIELHTRFVKLLLELGIVLGS